MPLCGDFFAYALIQAEVRDLKAVVGKADTERAALSDRDHAMNREVAELRSQIAAQKLITASALERLEVRHQRMSLMAENQLTRRMQAQVRGLIKKQGVVGVKVGVDAGPPPPPALHEQWRTVRIIVDCRPSC